MCQTSTKFKINIVNCIKYDSVYLFAEISMFIIYLFGFKNSFDFGEKYILATSFATLITDTQWDIAYAIKTVAQIDITKKEFSYNEHIKNSRKLVYLLIISSIIMGIILYIVDKKSKSDVEYENMSFKQTFLIGLSQCLAFIPGVSRSGITMTTGRAMGVGRESVAKYSFMLSAPIVLAATILKIKDFVFSIPFFIGVFASFIVGILVIKFLLNFAKIIIK